jgi:transposase
MSSKRLSRRARKGAAQFIQKPRGVIHPRVQQIGPEHFGIVCVDPAKARSKWMLCDFYGNVLVPPKFVAHNRVELDAAISEVRSVCEQRELRDVLVAVERTGRYHHPVKNAFRRADFDTRLVHPYATKQFRQPADPGNKTDDRDLAAMHRATVNGFALVEAVADESWQRLQLLIRHRRNLVQKNSALCSQIRHHLEVAMPGYAACFDKLWEHPVGMALVRQFDSAAALTEAGLDGLVAFTRGQGIRCQRRSLVTVLEWARNAAVADSAADTHRRIALAYDEDRRRKMQEIQALERTCAHLLARTPYILLLSFPGVNVVSAADFAGEMGPITNYANSRAITGRAGLFPARYQSDQTDRADGPLVRRANRALRAAILGIADNLILCNHYFNAMAARWSAAGKDIRHTHVKIGSRFCRIAFHMVAGRQVFRHPGLRERSYILDKLLAFHREHDTPWPETLEDLNQAVAHVPPKEYRAEAKPLRERLEKFERRRAKGPQQLGDLLAIVLARLGVGRVQSPESGENNLT